MHETEADLVELQRVLDESFDRSGAHLRSAFAQGARPSAVHLVDSLPGIFEMHLAVVTADGAPLVAPIDGLFYRGHVWVGIPEASVRARLVRRDPRVSASYAAGDVAFIVHGTLGPPTDEERAGFDAFARARYVEQMGDWFEAWLDERARTQGPGVSGPIRPRRLFATAPPPA